MILNKFDLTGKVAIVTGASRGLGQAMAIGLAEAGADIAMISTNAANLEETGKAALKLGRNVLAIECDVSDGNQIKVAIKQVVEAFSSIDILINNAGIIRRSPAHQYLDEDWCDVINTNLTGAFRFCRGVGKAMLERKCGKIINIASLLSFSGGISVPAYAASKGGVAQLTKALANEWAISNIQVNAIAPGYFATDNTENIRKDTTRYREISARIPAGRWGNPEDIVGAAVFLSSAAADYVNGQVLLVDGGWMAR